MPTTHMQCGWLGERVATANVSKVVENVLRNRTGEPSSTPPSLSLSVFFTLPPMLSLSGSLLCPLSAHPPNPLPLHALYMHPLHPPYIHPLIPPRVQLGTERHLPLPPGGRHGGHLEEGAGLPGWPGGRVCALCDLCAGMCVWEYVWEYVCYVFVCYVAPGASACV